MLLVLQLHDLSITQYTSLCLVCLQKALQAGCLYGNAAFDAECASQCWTDLDCVLYVVDSASITQTALQLVPNPHNLSCTSCNY